MTTTGRMGGGEWQARLYTRLRGQPYPLFAFGDVVMPAAALWAGARLWTAAFRDAGLQPGDRIVFALPPSAGFVQALVAAIWEGLTVALAPPPCSLTALERLAEETDARCAIANPLPDAASLPDWVFQSQMCEGPAERSSPLKLREVRLPGMPEARFLLLTSGTSSPNGGRVVALSDRNVLAVLDSHLPLLGLQEETSRVLSLLPWCHAFGLVLDLLASLLSGTEIGRPDPGSDLVAAGNAMQATHLNTVPLVIRRLVKTEEGRQFLRSLEGGVIGGAPVDAELAAFLRTTRLRVGYGQTEAGPGITLGEPGEWPGAGYLGRPLGCKVAVAPDGILHFSGPNACLGFWTPDQGLTPLPPDRLMSTGDLVRTCGKDRLFFIGRADDAFKLSNGRRIEAAVWEAAIVEDIPSVVEAMLFSPDGERLEVRLTVTADARPPSLERVRVCLGSLGARLCAVRTVSDDFWVRTPKGTRVRSACLEKLRW